MSRNKQGDKSLLVIGECMMELAGSGDSIQRAFAGDTYNSAVYAKRRYDNIDVQILTAVGRDSVSEAMKAQWDRGERSFTYWRKNSAATELAALLTDEIRARTSTFDMIFFSGITLAILPDSDKSIFLDVLTQARAKGTTIAFDPNYRPALWDDKHQATNWLSQAYRLVDIALPGLTDHREIFGHESVQDVRRFLDAFGIEEIILKAEENGVFGYCSGQPPIHLEITEQKRPTDTTGAGDSFAGTYLAERLQGSSVISALDSAAQIASLVVQHRGAIVDESKYREFIEGV